ncbi:MAG: ATP-grasp domain-containing protein [Deltaproteobacteria bacterium]|jgi:biotin carboxylase|nr:ATP-grasp domain-containing protein [Deltaproteobacteria bacterium]
MRKILVLGASKYQIPTILKAQSLGYAAVTADNLPDNPGHKLANVSHKVSTTDFSGLSAIAAQEKISGVIAPATDVAVTTAAMIAKAFGLPGPPIESAIILTDKANFRSFLTGRGFPCPLSWPFTKPKFPLSCPPDSGPWIIKPNRSSGSKGIFRITHPAQFKIYAQETLNFSLDKKGLIEQFIPGSQHTAEGLVFGGQVKVALITDRQTAPPPYVATWGHKVPSQLSALDQALVLDSLKKVFSLLNLWNGPFDCDFVFTAEKNIYFLELSPRIGGNSLSQLFDAALQTDFLRYAVNLAMGDKNPNFSFSKQPKVVAISLLGVMNSGKAQWQAQAQEEFSKMPGVLSFEMDIKPGDQVEPFINGRRVLGQILLTANSRLELDHLQQKVHQILDLKAV